MSAGKQPSAAFSPPTFLFGGDWSPELWSPETWREDIALMRRAKVNTVSIGIFSWASLEPAEGVYDTAWLDEVIDLLTEAEIGFFLATPTASPPPWFTLAHPEAMPVREDGTQLTHGSRDTYAISAPAYRSASGRSPGCSPSASGTIPVCAAGTCTTNTGPSTTALRQRAPFVSDSRLGTSRLRSSTGSGPRRSGPRATATGRRSPRRALRSIYTTLLS